MENQQEWLYHMRGISRSHSTQTPRKKSTIKSNNTSLGFNNKKIQQQIKIPIAIGHEKKIALNIRVPKTFYGRSYNCS